MEDMYRFTVDSNTVTPQRRGRTIAVFMTFTNNTGETFTLQRRFGVHLRQNGHDLKQFVTDHHDRLFSNFYEEVRPGQTMPFMLEWTLEDDSRLELSIPFRGGQAFTFSFMPGEYIPPHGEEAPEPLTVTEHEVYETTEWDDGTWHTAARFSFRYINRMRQNVEPCDLDIQAFQSGARLVEVSDRDFPLSGCQYDTIPAGSSAPFSKSWIVTTDRPVSVFAYDTDNSKLMQEEFILDDYPAEPRTTPEWPCAWPADFTCCEGDVSLTFRGLDRAGQTVLPRFILKSGKKRIKSIDRDCYIRVFQHGRSLAPSYLDSIRYASYDHELGRDETRQFAVPLAIVDNSPLDIVFSAGKYPERRIHMEMGNRRPEETGLYDRINDEDDTVYDMTLSEVSVLMTGAYIRIDDDGDRSLCMDMRFANETEYILRAGDIELDTASQFGSRDFVDLSLVTSDDFDAALLPGGSTDMTYSYMVAGDGLFTFRIFEEDDEGDIRGMEYSLMIEGDEVTIEGREPFGDDAPEVDNDDLFIFFTSWLYAKHNDGDTMGLPVFDYDAQAEAQLTEFEDLIMAAGGNPYDYEDFNRACRGDFSFRRDDELEAMGIRDEDDFDEFLEDDPDFDPDSVLDDEFSDLLDDDPSFDRDSSFDPEDRDFDFDDLDGFDDFDFRD